MKKLFRGILIIAVIIFSSDQSIAQWIQTELDSVGARSLVFDGINLYAGCANDGIYLSIDSGTHWIAVNNGLPSFHTVIDLTIAYGTTYNSVFAATYGGVYRSTDNGSYWLRVDNGFTHTDVYTIEAIPNSTGGVSIFAGTPDGIYRSTNNGTDWVQINNGLTYTWIVDFAFAGNYIFAANYEGGGVFLSTNNGNNWTPVNSGLTNLYITEIATVGTKIFAAVSGGSSNGDVFMSTNYGTSWSLITGNLPTFHVGALTGFGSNIFIGTLGEGGVYLSTNNGSTWTQVGLVNLWILDFEIIGSNIFAAASGVMWRPLYQMVPVELTSFTAETNNTGILLKWITATEVNNKGFEIERTSPLPSYERDEEEWKHIAFVPGRGTTTEQTSYSFRDTDVNYGIYKYRLKQIDYDGSFEYSDIVEVTIGLPQEYLLMQNYPNPFNPSTKIKYSIPEAGLVNLRVYNLMGQMVSELRNEVLQPGYYETEFDASSFSSGVYIYKLSVGKIVISRKMMVLK